MRYLSPFALATICLISLVSCGDDGDLSWSTVKQSGVLRIGISAPGLPLATYDPQDGREKGYEIDLARETCRRLGLVPEFHRIFWSEKYRSLENLEIDCIWSSLNLSKNREKRFLPSAPYLQSRKRVLVRDSSDLKTLAQLQGRRIGTLAGNTITEEKKHLPYLDSHTVLVAETHLLLGLLRLQTGAVDAFIADELDAAFLQHYAAGGSCPLRLLPGDFGVEDIVIGFRNEEYALRNHVQRVLNQIHNDGTAARLRARWFE